MHRFIYGHNKYNYWLIVTKYPIKKCHHKVVANNRTLGSGQKYGSINPINVSQLVTPGGSGGGRGKNYITSKYSYPSKIDQNST